MSGSCQDFEVLLSIGAAGALEVGEAERLEAHLEHCKACRDETGRLGEILGLAQLAPPGENELRAMGGLQARVLASWNRSEGGRRLWRRLAVGLAVAAAAAAMVLVPGALHRQPTVESASPATAEWQAPDVDDLWAASASVDTSAEDGSSLEESVIYAALQDTDAF